MRQKLKIQSELRKVRYDVERVYNIYMSLFFILFILIWPTVVVTVAWILYYLYEQKISGVLRCKGDEIAAIRGKFLCG